MKIGSLFSGYGGLDMGVQAVLGGDVAWHVKYDENPSRILAHHWPDVPNYGDITTVDWNTVEPVDVLTGGFPCQDLSMAGRRKGMRAGTRSGLWSDYLKAIDTLRPSLVIIENVRGLLSGCAESEADSELGPCPRCADPSSDAKHTPNVRALGRVQLDLARLGYVGRWGGVRASDAAAPHERFRVFIAAYPSGHEPERWGGTGYLGSAATQDEGSGGEWERLRNALGDRGEEAADATYLGYEWSGATWDWWDGSQDGREAAPDTAGARRGEGEDSGASAGDEGTGPRGLEPERAGGERTDWADHAGAIRLWEDVIGRVAPKPTDSEDRLSPLLTEWMMGLPEGHVTNPSIWAGMTPSAARAAQIKACGNGVVWLQAALALSLLLGHELANAAPREDMK